MKNSHSKKNKLLKCTIALVVFPITVMTTYIFLSRMGSNIGASTLDFVFVHISVLSGLYFVLRMPLKWPIKLCIAVIQIIADYVLLFLYTLYLMGAVFDEWL